jgi:hypothetical protein
VTKKAVAERILPESPSRVCLDGEPTCTFGGLYQSDLATRKSRIESGINVYEGRYPDGTRADL